jgi:hypothetical protein
MKSLTTFVAVLSLITSTAFSQSKSFMTLKEKFSGAHNSFSFTTSGFFARTILRLSGEHEYIHALRDVKTIRLIVIPESSFKAQHVTLPGFIRVAKQDSFEELAHVHDSGDDVTLLIQSPKKGKDNNRYLLLVDSDNEIVAIEVWGYIDPEELCKNNKNMAYSH